VEQFDREGYPSPVRILEDDRVACFRKRVESFEERFPAETKKLMTKSYLLCPG